jgi:hypothetical protein
MINAASEAAWSGVSSLRHAASGAGRGAPASEAAWSGVRGPRD